MQAWLSVEGVSSGHHRPVSAWSALPYTFKFLWAPLMDRFELPLLGRRRGWLVLTQLACWRLALYWRWRRPRRRRGRSLLRGGWPWPLALRVGLAGRGDRRLPHRLCWTRGRARAGRFAVGVAGYRLAMILSGGIALIWADPVQGSGWTWPEVYRLMAALMLAAAVLSAVVLPPLPGLPAGPPGERRAPAWVELRGFAAVVAAVAVGVWLSDRYGPDLAQALAGSTLRGGGLPPALQQRWLDLLALLLGIAFTLPLAVAAARLAGFHTLLGGLSNYFSQPGAAAFLLLIVLYKLGDAFAWSLMTAFLLKSMAYSPAEVGVVNQVVGLWLTILGALVGGALMLKLGLWRSLMLFGVLQLLSNLGFWWLAVSGKGVLPGATLPAFDWGFVKLAAPTPVDGGLLMVVAFENLSGGMGTAAFVAFMMSLCNQRFTATQYALLSAFASVGRVWVGPLAGVLAESIGWPAFFLISTVLAAPALLMLWWLRGPVRALQSAPGGGV
jgi:PAT family beta-lactamase induction signal transducer AmpG